MTAEVPGFIFLGRLVEKLKGFTAIYLALVSVLLTNLISNHTWAHYRNREVELSFGGLLDFLLSANGALFITVGAFIIAAHYVVMPLVLQGLMYLVRGLFIGVGNLFFYSVYIVLTKMLRHKADRKFFFIREPELLNYLMYVIRVCYYKDDKIGRHRNFKFYKWYVLNIVHPPGRTAGNVSLTMALIVSTLAIAYCYNFIELAPVVYYIVLGVAIFSLVNAIIVSWIIKLSGYFVGIITNSVTFPDFADPQQQPADQKA